MMKMMSAMIQVRQRMESTLMKTRSKTVMAMAKRKTAKNKLGKKKSQQMAITDLALPKKDK